MWVRLWVVMVVGGSVGGWFGLFFPLTFMLYSTCLLAAVVRCLLRWLLLSLLLSWLSVCLCLCTCPLSLVAVLVGRFSSCLCRSFCWRRSALAGLWLSSLAVRGSCPRLQSLAVVGGGGCLRCLLLVVAIGGRGLLGRSRLFLLACCRGLFAWLSWSVRWVSTFGVVVHGWRLLVVGCPRLSEAAGGCCSGWSWWALSPWSV